MAIKPDYQAGNASVAVGGTTVTFAGGANITAATITAGDTFKVQNLDAVIASVTDSTHLELAEPWSGTALVAGPYRIRFQPDGSRYSAAVKDLVDTLGNGNVLALAGLTGALDEIPIFTGAGSMATISKINLTQGIDVDVKVETLAERAGYDGQAAGYSVLVANVGDGRSAVYFKVSNTSGDWSDPAYLTGPNGSFQSKGIYSGATAYQLGDVVLQNGSSWIARVNTTGNAPPALPTTSNTQWFLLSAAGNTFTIKGAYNPATAYLKDDVVTDAGSSWIAIQSTTGNAPPVQPSQSNAYWNLLSAKGTDGAVQGVLTPQGRLSLVSGVAVPTSDVVAATTLYYVPCIGTRVPVWDGTQMVLRDIGSGLSVALSATYQVAFNQIDWFVFMDGATLRLGHGPNWSAGAVAGSQFARGTGAGSTELELKNGIYTNKNSITLRFGTVAGNTVTVPANQATYLGSTGNDGTAGTLEFSALKRLVYNAYNQTPVPLSLIGTGATWSYGTNAYRAFNGDSTFRVSIFCGLPTLIDLQVSIDVTTSGAMAAYVASFGLDSTTTEIAAAAGLARDLVSSAPGQVVTPKSRFVGVPSIGMHRFYALETAPSSIAGTWRFFGIYGIRGFATI